MLTYHELDLRSKSVFFLKTGENLYDILVEKAITLIVRIGKLLFDNFFM